MANAKVATKRTVEKNGAPVGIAFDFQNGDNLEILIDNLPEHLIPHLVVHGLGQKIGDSYAGVKGDVNAAIQNAQAVIDQLLAGEWNAKRQGSGGIIIDVLLRMNPDFQDDRTAAQAWLNEREAEKEGFTAQLKKHPQFRLLKAEIEQERLQQIADGSPEISFD
jgi:hypothetical protein